MASVKRYRNENSFSMQAFSFDDRIVEKERNGKVFKLLRADNFEIQVFKIGYRYKFKSRKQVYLQLTLLFVDYLNTCILNIIV